MKRIFLLSLITLLLASTLSFAGSDGRWLHVRVDEGGSNGEKVNVNIPLSLVEAILPAIEIDELNHGRIRIDDGDLNGLDLQELLEALRDAPDADYVTVQSDDENVRVSKEDGFLLVRVDEEHGDHVRVRLPLDVVDAMLGAGDGEIDILAGLQALADYDGGDLITVESDDSSVRVWIDSNNSSD